MLMDLIPPRLRQLLRDYFSDYGTLKTIHDAFQAEQVSRGELRAVEVSGQRRQLVEEYYASLNFELAQDATKFINILSGEMVHLKTLEIPEASVTFEKLRQAARRGGIEYDNGQLTSPFAVGVTGIIGTLADVLNLAHLRAHVDRIEHAVDRDPSQVVGSAKELLETCCKTIILDHGEKWADTATLPQLIKQAQRTLRLLPEDVDDAARGADTIRILLNNLGAIVKGVTELRGLYGTGHGREGKFRGLKPRHSRLAVGSAITLATFLIETHLERQTTEPPDPIQN